MSLFMRFARRHRRGAAAVTTFAIVTLATTASAAWGSTTVSGDADRLSPLVIEPSGTGDVRASSGILMFIQKMPVTKTVNRITLGDIGSESCAGGSDPGLELFVRQHPTGALREQTPWPDWEGNSLDFLYISDHDVERRTWKTEPITFVKGRGYSFWVDGDSPCVGASVRTWPHNQAKVNAGARCDEVIGGGNRMWHTAGENDATPCGYAVPQNFDPTMPEGWLSVYDWGYPNTYVRVISDYDGGGSDPPDLHCDGEERGAMPVRWRDTPGMQNWGDYVCVWDQLYADFSTVFPTDPPDGWYYAVPGFPNPPRDMYVKLELDEADLAAWYKPNLYFDTGERWRPLNVDHFFDERDSTNQPMHRRCQPPPAPPGSNPDDLDPWGGANPDYCPRAGTPTDLMGRNAEDTYIKVNGFDAIDDDDYRSPNAACLVDGLYDCNGGLISTLYYYVSKPYFESHYRYIGYWAFYRFNSFGEVGDHEGDWEGVALAPSRLRPGTFDFASFSSHGPWYSYLRDTLTCADNPYENPPRCGTQSAPAFSHVRTYVAESSHANYPKPCSNTGTNICERAAGIYPERGYDGARSWGHNSNASELHASGLTAFPTPGTSWINWLGQWGKSGSPRSPGEQDEFDDPWSGCGYGEACSQPSSVRSGTPRGASVPRRPRGRVPAPSACGRWFGPGVAALACREGSLRRAVRSGTLGRTGSVSLRIRRGSAQAARRAPRPAAASSPPLAQLLADPLAPGDELRVRAHTSRPFRLLIRYGHGNREFEAAFENVRLTSRGVNRVSVRRRQGKLSPTLTLANGKRIRPISDRRLP